MANNRGGSRIGGQLAVHLGNLLDLIKTVHGSGSGIDADTVDTRHVDDTKTDTTALWTANKINTQFATAMRRVSPPGTSDCNDFLDLNGFFSWDTGNGAFNNTPKGNLAAGSGQVFIIENKAMGTNANRQVQQCTFIYPSGTIDIYVRNYTGNSTWSAWYKIYHAGNDGSGSGLDADKLDNLESTQFMRFDANNSVTDIQLTMTSTTNTPPIVLQGASSGWASGLWLNNTTTTTGKKYGLYSGSDGRFVITDETGAAHRFSIASDGTLYAGAIGSNKIWHAGNGGAGSLLDADKLDSLHASSFARTDAASTIDAGNIISPLTIKRSAATYQQVALGFISTDGTTTFNGYIGINSGVLKFGATSDLSAASSYKIWHEGNMGSNNGLDADKLDTLHASSFVRNDLATAQNIISTLSIAVSSGSSGLEIGKVTASDTPYIDFHTSGNNIDYDARIVATGGSATIGTGTLTLYAGTVQIGTNRILTVADEGSGKSLDADTVDTLHATDLLKSDVNSEQVVSGSEIRVQSTSSTERFGIEYNETEGCLDFIYYTA